MPVEMVQFFWKLLLKQRILDMQHNFQWLLVSTKLVSFSLKTQHYKKNNLFKETVRIAYASYVQPTARMQPSQRFCAAQLRFLL